MNSKPANYINVSLVSTRGKEAVITMSTPTASVKRVIDSELLHKNSDYRKELFERLFLEVKDKEMEVIL